MALTGVNSSRQRINVLMFGEEGRSPHQYLMAIFFGSSLGYIPSSVQNFTQF